MFNDCSLESRDAWNPSGRYMVHDKLLLNDHSIWIYQVKPFANICSFLYFFSCIFQNEAASFLQLFLYIPDQKNIFQTWIKFPEHFDMVCANLQIEVVVCLVWWFTSISDIVKSIRK